MKVSLAAMDEKLDGNKKELVEKFEKVELVQEQLNLQEASNRRLEVDNVEIKKSLNDIIKQLGKMTQALHEFRLNKRERELQRLMKSTESGRSLLLEARIKLDV